MKILFIIPIVLLVLFCLYFYCIMPRLTRKKEAQSFLHHLFAHRGLFTKDQSIPENSMAAFANAVEHGYGSNWTSSLPKTNSWWSSMTTPSPGCAALTCQYVR